MYFRAAHLLALLLCLLYCLILKGVDGVSLGIYRFFIGLRRYWQPAALSALAVLFFLACVSSPAADLSIPDTGTENDEARFMASANVLLISSAPAPILVPRMVSTARAGGHLRDRMSRRRSSYRSVNPLLIALSILPLFIPWLRAPVPALTRGNGVMGVHEFLKSHIGEKRFGDESGAPILARSFHGFRVTVLSAALSLFYFLSPHIMFNERFAGPAVLTCLAEGGIQP